MSPSGPSRAVRCKDHEKAQCREDGEHDEVEREAYTAHRPVPGQGSCKTLRKVSARHGRERKIDTKKVGGGLRYVTRAQRQSSDFVPPGRGEFERSRRVRGGRLPAPESDCRPDAGDPTLWLRCYSPCERWAFERPRFLRSGRKSLFERRVCGTCPSDGLAICCSARSMSTPTDFSPTDAIPLRTSSTGPGGSGTRGAAGEAAAELPRLAGMRAAALGGLGIFAVTVAAGPECTAVGRMASGAGPEDTAVGYGGGVLETVVTASTAESAEWTTPSTVSSIDEAEAGSEDTKNIKPTPVATMSLLLLEGVAPDTSVLFLPLDDTEPFMLVVVRNLNLFRKPGPLYQILM